MNLRGRVAKSVQVAEFATEHADADDDDKIRIVVVVTLYRNQYQDDDDDYNSWYCGLTPCHLKTLRRQRL